MISGTGMIRELWSVARPDRDRPHVGLLEEEQADEEVAPDLDELEDRHGDDGRDGQRQHDRRKIWPYDAPSISDASMSSVGTPRK